MICTCAFPLMCWKGVLLQPGASGVLRPVNTCHTCCEQWEHVVSRPWSRLLGKESVSDLRAWGGLQDARSLCGMSQVWAWRAFDHSSVEAQEEWSLRGRSPGGQSERVGEAQRGALRGMGLEPRLGHVRSAALIPGAAGEWGMSARVCV